MAIGRKPKDPIDRFYAKVVKHESGCWLWTGYTDKKGYGIFGITSKNIVKAHRYSYEKNVGEIPDGLYIDHLCRVCNCVNPDHLEPVTNQENVIRGNNARPKQTKCKRGHDFSDSNTYLNPNGRRECKTCRSDAVKRFNERSA